ncbi:MAG TPA: MerR family transcriptional regulator [Anaerolineae bacterium]|nr:MerR family transcriptional regulator [Anaerolineae bacterium]HOQ99601.1 MerR family transcriptional regulator [Anaerolineae bacterium]HPL30061.1 MerR family transcriptional regulator [Anaerolineae bacterium]
MIRIGDFSRLGLVSIKTLRHYDELGLLKPVRVDRFTGYRYYAVEQLGRLNRILALKDLGLSLEQIAGLLSADVSAEEIRGMLRLKQAEAQSRIQEAQAQLTRVATRLRQIEKEGSFPMYEVVLKQIPAQRVAAIRRVLPNYGALGALSAELFGPQMQGARYAGPPLVIYHDHEFKDENVDVEVAVPVAGPLPEGAPAEVRELPGGEMACVVYLGPYEGIGEGYNAVMAWLEPNGYRIADCLREVYLRGPGDGNDPAQYVTEIQVPAVRV